MITQLEFPYTFIIMMLKYTPYEHNASNNYIIWMLR